MPDQSKSEQPTQRRIDKARREGQFASAREFVSALQFLAFLGLIRMAAGSSLAGFRRLMRDLVDLAFMPQLSPADIVHTARLLLWSYLAPDGSTRPHACATCRARTWCRWSKPRC
jgi:flagellar biosynthesis protein FlhB